jgi:hypothetical protein
MRKLIYKLLVLIPIFIILSLSFLIQNSEAQWTQTSGPVSGWISSFTVIGNNLFAGTFSTGVFLSTNNGANWSQVNNGLTDPYIGALAVIGTNLFAGTRGSGPIMEQTGLL